MDRKIMRLRRSEVKGYSSRVPSIAASARAHLQRVGGSPTLSEARSVHHVLLQLRGECIARIQQLSHHGRCQSHTYVAPSDSYGSCACRTLADLALLAVSMGAPFSLLYAAHFTFT
jgi:hypothetical protein